jgi:hypothetical protein
MSLVRTLMRGLSLTGHLPSVLVGGLIQTLVVVAISSMAAWRIWLAYRAVVVREQERSARMTRAIDGAKPSERSEIIRACGDLESAESASTRRLARGSSRIDS